MTKKSNLLWIVIAIVAVTLVIGIISWTLTKSSPVMLQGEADATSYKAASKVAGRIDRMVVREGQQVRKGDLLYVLSTPEIDAKMVQAKAAQSAAGAQALKAHKGARSQEVEAAREIWQKATAGLDLAEKSYNRVKKLYEEGVLPAQKHDEAQANFHAARATAAAANAQYQMALEGARNEDKTAADALTSQAAGAVSEVEAYAADAYVYSPVDGEISTIIAREGELVGSGYPAVTLLDMNDLWVSYNIKETLMPSIRMGMKFMAYVPALDKEIEFVVDYIAPQGDFATWSATRTQGGFDVRTFKVKTRPTSYVEGLRPGMSAIMNLGKVK